MKQLVLQVDETTCMKPACSSQLAVSLLISACDSRLRLAAVARFWLSLRYINFFWQILPVVDNLDRAVNELNRQQVSGILKKIKSD